MDSQLQLHLRQAQNPELDFVDIKTTFFRCVRWQVEETLDPINCPYHYFCDGIYSGNEYPPVIDILALLLIATSFLATLVLMITEVSKKGRKISLPLWKRYLLPSGPVFLPLILLILAKGQKINTLFPVTCFGPIILQLVYISALSFNYSADEDLKYAFFEASTISGIFHASIYLDAVILPYYTGYDALLSSRFSGGCTSCVCRKEALEVGGKLVSYRGCSVTTFVVVCTLCLRIICKVFESYKGKLKGVQGVLECLCWIFIVKDSVNLVINSPPDRFLLPQVAAFGGMFVLVCLHLLRKLCSSRILQPRSKFSSMRNEEYEPAM